MSPWKPYVCLEAVLTDAEKRAIEQTVRERDPGLKQATLADLLSIAEGHDIALPWTAAVREDPEFVALYPSTDRRPYLGLAVLGAALIQRRQPTAPEVQHLYERLIAASPTETSDPTPLSCRQTPPSY